MQFLPDPPSPRGDKSMAPRPLLQRIPATSDPAHGIQQGVRKGGGWTEKTGNPKVKTDRSIKSRIMVEVHSILRDFYRELLILISFPPFP